MTTVTTTSGSTQDYRSEQYWKHLSSALASTFQPRLTAKRGLMECPPDWRWRQALTDFDLWLVTKGRGRMHLPEQTLDLEAGTLLFLRPGDKGWAVQDPKDRLTVIYIHLDFYSVGCEYTVTVPDHWLPDRYVPFSDTSLIEPMLLRLLRLMESRQPLSEFEASLTIQHILLQVYRQDAVNSGVIFAYVDPRVDRIRSYLQSSPNERLSLKQASHIAGLSEKYFSRLFRSSMGISFREFTLRVRLDRARMLLEETEMSVTQIADALGYTDVYLFSRQFKNYFGISPTRLRRS